MPTEYFWPLDADPGPLPEEPDVVVDAATSLSAARPAADAGILFPLKRSAADYQSAQGAALVEADLRFLLGTRCDKNNGETQGELPWETEFGSLLPTARHRNNDAVLGELVRQWTADAVARWMPDVRVRRVTIDRATSDTGERLVARIAWEVVSGGRAIAADVASVPLTATTAR